MNDSFYCKCQNAQPKYQVRGILPTDEATIGNKSFTNVAVVYFWRILVKLTRLTRSKNAKAKQWEVICTYLSTFTVHYLLQLYGDLSMDLVLLTMRIFLSRRKRVSYALKQ